MNRAIVVGSEGQDGSLLFDRLELDGREVIGLGRDTARASGGGCQSVVDITDREAVSDLIAGPSSDVFFLAAVHQSSETPNADDTAGLFDRSWSIHVGALINFLDALASSRSGALFYAGSSHVFGDPHSEPQTELTPFAPQSPYAITKAAGIHACRYYRQAYDVRASTGIMFNHESPLRSRTFLSQKIASAAAGIAKSGEGKLVIGNLKARADWGYAPDFVDAMIRIVCAESADDFVIATGETHSVEEFVGIAFDHVGLDWRKYVVEDAGLLTRPAVTRVGDPSKLESATGWKRSVTFRQLVTRMVDAAMERA